MYKATLDSGLIAEIENGNFHVRSKKAQSKEVFLNVIDPNALFVGFTELYYEDGTGEKERVFSQLSMLDPKLDCNFGRVFISKNRKNVVVETDNQFEYYVYFTRGDVSLMWDLFRLVSVSNPCDVMYN